MRHWPRFSFFYASILDEVGEINAPLAYVDLLNRKDRAEVLRRNVNERCPSIEKTKNKANLYVQAAIGNDLYIMSGLGRALEIYFDSLLHPDFWNSRS